MKIIKYFGHSVCFVHDVVERHHVFRCYATDNMHHRCNGLAVVFVCVVALLEIFDARMLGQVKVDCMVFLWRRIGAFALAFDIEHAQLLAEHNYLCTVICRRNRTTIPFP